MMLVADRLMRPAVGFNPLDRAIGDDAQSLRRVMWAATVDGNAITSRLLKNTL